MVRPRVGPRAVLRRPPDPGRRSPCADPTPGRRRPARCGVPGRRPGLCHVRRRRDRARLRAPGDRGGAGRARPRDRASQVPDPGLALHRPAWSRHPRGHRMGTGLLPGRRPDPRRRRAARARRPGRLPRRRSGRRRGGDRRRRPARRVLPPSGTTPSRAAPTSPAGKGSHHQDEAFGDDWVLPPDRAYSETCAGVASIMFSLAPAAGHRARQVRRPDRADPVQRHRHLAGRDRHRVLLRQHPAPASTRAPCPRPTWPAPGPSPPCAPPGSRCPAARRTSRAPWPAWPATSRPPTPPACRSTSTPPLRSAAPCPTAAGSRWTSRRRTPPWEPFA